MRRFAALLVMAMLVASKPVYSSIPSWSTGGPGAGGNFTCVDVSAPGRVLVGSDVSGLYGRNGNSGNWTRYGPLDGLRATQILNVRFKPNNPSQVLCGTGNGVYYSNNSGQSWSEAHVNDGLTSTATYGKDVSAVGFGRNADSTYALIAWKDEGTINLASAWYASGGGPSFSQLVPGTAIPADTIKDDHKWTRTPIKIVFDPSTTGSSRTYFVLMGVGLTANRSDPQGRTLKEIWYTTDNGAHFYSIVNIDSIRVSPIDIAVSNAGSKLLITTTTSDEVNENGHDDLRGNVASCVIGTWSWTVHSLSDAACNACPDQPYQALPTGACWWDGSDAYVLNVQRDACPSTCGAAGDSCAAGLWMSASGGSWSRIDDGRGNKSGTTTWDKGWTTCPRARGRTIDNCALSVSGKGEYWVTTQFVWLYEPSGTKKYSNAFTSGETGPWTTKRLDNANPVIVELDGSSPPAPWVGYYDLGLWKLTSSGWENKNSDGQSGRPDWGWSSSGGGYGGNVNSIVFDGSNIYVTVAPSSKDNEWRLCRSQNGGASDSWAHVGSGLPTSGTVFLNSLIKGPGIDTKWWVTVNGRLWSASAPTGTWSAVSDANSVLPDTGIMVMASNGATVLAGGWSGLFRSTDNGAHWSAVSSIAKPTPAAGSPADRGYGNASTKPALHKRLWYGAQQILYDPDTPAWYVVLYAPSGGLDSGSQGVWRSADDGVTFSALTDSVQRRSVAVDSCGQRLHIASGQPFSGGVNNDEGIYRATGKQTCRLCNNGCSMVCVPAVAVGNSERDPLFGYLAGHTLRTYDDGQCSSTSATVYMAVPGYGLMWHSIAGIPASSPCETQLHGGGDAMGARGTVEEAGPSKIGRQVFTLAEVRDRILFDVSGRRAKVQRAGVYFDPVVKDGRVVRRRTVLVTP